MRSRTSSRSQRPVSALTASTGGPDDNDAQAGHLVPVHAWPLALRGRDDGAELEVGEEGVYNALRAGDGGSSRQSLVAIQYDDLSPTHTLTAEGFDASEDGTGRGTPLVPHEASPPPVPWSLAVNTVTGSNGQPGTVVIPIETKNATRRDGSTGKGTAGTGIGVDGDPASTVGTSGVQSVATFRKSTRAASAEHDETWVEDEISNTVTTFDVGDKRATELVVEPTIEVRRLTPLECERLQSFPDGWTLYDADGNEIADGPRYRFMGNAVALPPTQWVMDGIAAIVDRESTDPTSAGVVA
jgi:site-specific DNA-cytosine methylase